MGVSSDGRTVETEILDDGLTASDPAFALERLTFDPNGLSTLRPYRGVRDYLLDIQRTGCEAAQARESELENDMQPLAEEIITAPLTSLGGLVLCLNSTRPILVRYGRLISG